MKRLIAFLALVLAWQGTAGQALGAARESARNLTVRLFYSAPVASVRVEPVGGNVSVSECSGCPARRLAGRFEVDVAPGSRAISVHTGDPANESQAAKMRRLEMDGALGMAASGLVAEDSEMRASAAGHWVIRPGRSGLEVLLTLPSEKYVAAAVSGEAAPDEPFESLKAMAVMARTFALTNVRRHGGDGFDLCDSTHCQALRFGAVRDEVERAVLDTAGETLWSGAGAGARRAAAYYTQDCGGVTESAANVWPEQRESYLRSHPDPYCVRRAPAVWHAEIGVDQVAAIARSQGWRVPRRIDSVRVLKRTSSGRAAMLEFAGGGDRAEISASSFHFAVDRDLGWNKIRSEWYSVSLAGGVLRFDGRGFGHGVGLCQAGAREMAGEGKTYRQILEFYLPGTRVGVAGDDGGLIEVAGPGWTLHAMATFAPGIAGVGNDAWARAQVLFPASHRSQRVPEVRPEVYALPSTELFRQTAGEPGWVLGDTQVSAGAEWIFLQPVGVIERNGSLRSTMLHEFLHVLVEREAGARGPLWLREGLVEALAARDGSPAARGRGERPSLSVGAGFSVDAADAGLLNRSDRRASQRAHDEAGWMVRGLLDHYGLETVRGWLRSGVPAVIGQGVRPAV